jgi:hypothetical protein
MTTELRMICTVAGEGETSLPATHCQFDQKILFKMVNFELFKSQTLRLLYVIVGTINYGG